MTDVALGEKALPLLPGAHRVIRALDASETPFVGLLVTRGDGVAVQLDAEELAGWAGWGFAGAEHVAGPLDLVRRAEGHDVLLPWCTERITTLLGRRRAADDPPGLGECCTLVASLLRGIDELGEEGRNEAGTWWLTGEGRPVFVIGEGSDALRGAARVVELLAESSRDKAMGRLLAHVQKGLDEAQTQPRIPPRQIEAWERELLEIAAPRPLRCDVHAPERARDVARAVSSNSAEADVMRARRRARTDSTSRVMRRARDRGSSRPALRGVLMEGTLRLRELVAPRFASISHGEGRERSASAASRPGGKKRMLLVAGGAAVAVVVGGLMLPGGDSGEAADETVAPTVESEKSSASPTPAESPGVAPASAEPTEHATSAGDASADATAVEAAEVILATVRNCTASGATSCDGVVAPGSETALTEAGEVATSGARVELVDEYGDVAVIRVLDDDAQTSTTPQAETAPPASSGHIIVLVRMDEKWLVRDIYDVADQPG